MDRRNNPAGEPCRDWKGIVIDALYALSLVFMGAVIGVAMCKFWPEFWWFINWGGRA